jgi:hypothetical protein
MTADLLQALRHIQVNIRLAKDRLADLDDDAMHPSDAVIVGEAWHHLNIASRQVRAALSEGRE